MMHGQKNIKLNNKRILTFAASCF